MPPDPENSLGDGATFSGQLKQSRSDMSLGDERTLSGGDAAGLDTVLDDIEIVDLAARYKVERPLGEGGMGAVVLATDTRLGRQVAIKQIRGESARSKSTIARFLTEARAIAAISHPNVVQIYELGVAKTGPFLVIEYIDGGSLLDRCKSGAIPMEEAVEIFVHICQGLGRAHDLGIVHRDIKPANILLTKDGIAKLTDFGLAKAEAADHGMTMAGAVMGTPDFMPPEQRQDAALVDHRSDLWSLAAAFYQAVSGRSPKVIRLHELPQALQPIMSKALEDEKDARYQSAKEFRDALKSVLGGQVESAKPAVFEGVLQEGQCKACGTVNPELGRKFCKKCGASLRMPCLACDVQIPVWDKICGECGGNQPALLEAKHVQISGQKASAEALVADLEFDKAIGIAEELAKETHPELAAFVIWSRSFIESTNAERDRQQALSAERLKDGQTHFAAFDYAAAIQAIEATPESLRVDKASKLLAESRSRQDESVRLVEAITSRIKGKELEGLLPLVSRAVELRGDRKNLLKIQQQLEERRDKKISLAQAAMEAGNARTAAATLVGAVAEDLGPGGGDLLKRVQRAAALEVLLVEGIKSAKADGVVTPDEARGLLVLCEEYLLLNPQGVKVQKIREQLQGVAHPIPMWLFEPSVESKPLSTLKSISKASSGVSGIFVQAPKGINPTVRGVGIGIVAIALFVLLINLSIFVHELVVGPTIGLKDAVERAAVKKMAADKAADRVAASKAFADKVAAKKEAAKKVFADKVAAKEAAASALTNTFGMEFVKISKGGFQMSRHSTETPVAVRFSEDFELGKTEVTQGQWQAVMGTSPWVHEGGRSQIGEDNAASDVNWDDATAFCQKLTDLKRKAGKLKTNEVYRLPTEAEWECACRAGTQTAFSFGDDESKLGEYAWWGGWDSEAASKGEMKAGPGTAGREWYAHKVGMKKPNPWGLYDMHGNVGEWCSDRYDDTLPGNADPVGPEGGSYRVIRGGSWLDSSHRCQSASYNPIAPSSRLGLLGFRVARSQSAQ